MKKVTSCFMIALAILAFFSMPANAEDSMLKWDHPTTFVNESAIPADAYVSTELYKNGVLAYTVPYPANSYSVPGVCSSDVNWTAVAVVKVETENLKSDPSNSVRQPIDKVDCRPKPPTGFGFQL